MVDRGTARMLVYGALATLALILVVAIYALATKGSIQSELERKLDLLAKKEADLRRNEQERDRALNQYKDAQEKVDVERRNRRKVEEQRDQYHDEFDKAEHQKSDYHDEVERLGRKLWDKDDQHQLEELEKKSEEDLMSELEKEGEEFFGKAHELGEEHLDGDDEKELERELDAAKKYEEEFKNVRSKLRDGDEEGDEDALEGLEELGEHNEVFLDELARDAKRNTGKKWKHPDHASEMGKLAKDIDLHAEALRNKKYVRKHLERDQHHLDDIEKEAMKESKNHGDNEEDDFKYAGKVKDIAKNLEADEERLMRELDDVDEPEEYEAARRVEEDAEKDDLDLAGLEQMVEDDTKLSPKQKAAREKMIKDLEKEIEEVEQDAMHVSRGLERRHVRRDANKMERAANRLDEEAIAKGKHGKDTLKDVNQIVSDEHGMLDAMKHNNIEDEEKYGAKLNEEAEGLEEDAEKLFDEADAGDYDDLDDKLIDEQLAKELEDAGDDMEEDAADVDHGDRARSIRHAGEEIEHEAKEIGDVEKDFGKAKSVRADADRLDKEAQDLGRAVGEEDWENEAKLAEQAIKDSGELDQDAAKMDEEFEGADLDKIAQDLHLDKDAAKHRLDEDRAAVKKMRGAGARLRHEAEGVLHDVHEKAQHRQEKLAAELHRAEQAAKAAKAA